MPDVSGANGPVDEAARQWRMGRRQSVFVPISRRRRSPVARLIVPAVMFAFVLFLLGSAGLLSSFIGIFLVALFVLMFAGAFAGMRITAKDAASGQEMHLFDEGVVIRGPKGRILPYRWDQTRLIRHGKRPAGTPDSMARWSYGLLNPTTPPVLMGQTVATGALIRNSEGVDLANAMRVAEFDRMDIWGPALEQAITAVHLPMALHELSEGRAVGFGPATALPDGLAIGKRVTPWQDISAVDIAGGYLNLKVRGKFFKSSVLANDVPNFLVLAAVVNHFRTVTPG